MTHDHTNTNPDLHLHDDPKLAHTESLLDLLAKQDANAMPSGLESRVLDSISNAIAPPPLAITQGQQSSRSNRMWSLRFAAAVALAAGTTLLIVDTNPWSSNVGLPAPVITLASSFEQNLDDYFALESLDDGNLSEAVTEWEIWAQSVDMDIDSTLTGFDWYEPATDDGAI